MNTKLDCCVPALLLSLFCLKNMLEGFLSLNMNYFSSIKKKRGGDKSRGNRDSESGLFTVNF